MIDENNASTANDETCLVRKSDLTDVHHRMVMLKGLIEGCAHLDNDGHANALTAAIDIALEYAGALDDQIDRLDWGVQS